MAITLLAFFASFAAAQAATVTLTANKDTSLFVAATGNESVLVAKPGQSVLVGFDLTSIPIGSVIEKVQLHLYYSEFTDTGGISYALSSLIAPNEAWTESATSLTVPSSVLTTLFGASSFGGYTVFTGETGSGFLQIAQHYVNNPSENYGFGFDYVFPVPNPGLYEELSYYSREGGLLTGHAPVLTITYSVPEPATAVLGIFGLGFLFRRKRQG